MSSREVATILANIRVTSKRLTAAADAAAMVVAEAAAQDASSRAPVDSGALRDSLMGGPGSVGPNGVRRLPEDQYDRHIFDIGSELEYAGKIEYQDVPMVRPAVNEHAAELTRSIHEAARAVLR